MWAVLRALQQINSATRIEGDAAMSASPFFHSAGRGDLRRTNGSNMGEPIRTRKGKLAGRVEHDARLGRVVKSKKGAEEFRSFELSGKEIFFNYDDSKSKEEKNKKNRSKKQANRGQSVRYRWG